MIDVAPTVLEAAGLPEPTFVNGVQQMPLQGGRMAYSFDDAGAPERHETQYFEMFVQPRHLPQGLDRGHAAQHAVGRWRRLPAFDDDVWELYAPDDWTQAHDLAAEQPEKLHELQRLFLIEAAKYNVLPLDDRRVERFNPDLAGRPQLIQGNSPAAVRRHGAADRELGGRASRTSRMRSRRRSMVPEGGADGVIIAQGGAFGGWSLYVQRRQAGLLLQPLRPAAVQDLRRRADPRRRAPGADGVRLRRRRARPRAAPTLYVDGPRSARGAGREGREPMIFSADETTDVGADSATPVSDD